MEDFYDQQVPFLGPESVSVRSMDVVMNLWPTEEHRLLLQCSAGEQDAPLTDRRTKVLEAELAQDTEGTKPLYKYRKSWKTVSTV